MLKNFDDCMKTMSMCSTHLSAMELWSEKYGCSINKSSQILEVGSWNGLFLELLRSEWYTNYAWIDPDPRHGRKRLSVQKWIVENINPNNEKFDCIRTSSVFDKLFYWDNTSSVLQKVHQLLKPNGIYFWFEPIESEKVIDVINNIIPRANSIIFWRNWHEFIPASK